MNIEDYTGPEEPKKNVPNPLHNVFDFILVLLALYVWGVVIIAALANENDCPFGNSVSVTQTLSCILER
jgi:hypothetical protein